MSRPLAFGRSTGVPHVVKINRAALAKGVRSWSMRPANDVKFLFIRHAYWYTYRMEAEKKITVMLPQKLLKRALHASGEGLTPTLRRGLELVAARDVYRQLLKLKGKVDLKLDLDDSRRDRDE